MDWLSAVLAALGGKIDATTVITLVILLIHDRRLADITSRMSDVVKLVAALTESDRSQSAEVAAAMQDIRKSMWRIAKALGAREHE